MDKPITLERDTRQVAATMFIVLLFGIVVVTKCLWSANTVPQGLLWAGAWSAIGWFLGFLFGIPRYLATDTARTPGASAIEKSKITTAKADSVARMKQDDLANAQAAQKTAQQAVVDANLAQSQAVAAATAAGTALSRNLNDQGLIDAKNKADKAVDEANKKVTIAAGRLKTATTATTDAQAAVQTASDEATLAKQKLDAAASGTSDAPHASLTVNTNLEQISDWLTKIIVGVSLVESSSLLNLMQRASWAMARSIGDPSSLAVSKQVVAAVDPAASAVAQATATAALMNVATARASMDSLKSLSYAILLYFLVTGLLGSYLLTRLFLQRALDTAAARVD